MSRRECCAATAAAGFRRVFAPSRAAGATTRRLVIGGPGEIDLDYAPARIDEVRASGMRCAITLGNPALSGGNLYRLVRDSVG